MALILTLLSLLMIYMGVTMIWKPNGLPGMIKLYADEVGLQVLASIGRILLGLVLIIYAEHSRLPMVLTVLGWISLITGGVFLFMKQQQFTRFIRIAAGKASVYGRCAGGFAVIIGLLILYAVW